MTTIKGIVALALATGMVPAEARDQLRPRLEGSG